ncbi:MAG TPA: 1-acyl-sn-glycerol-3-phosphate acyltransferase [Abditibacteriaceae bacterium]|jgi:1-acyl-sn-glycerol-3-phosphate acyltransferase
MKQELDFRPARSSPAVLRVGRTLLPLALRQRAIARIEIADSEAAKLRALAGERVVLVPNHPTKDDPALMFELSRRANMPFHYLCCREAFDCWGGLWGRLIQGLGAYSVVRGTIDRESFRYTRELLARPAAKLVLFPEGEVYSQNDSLLPFQTGAVQLALWGREEARKTDPSAQVLLLPCALRYRFAADVRPQLRGKLARLERELKLPPPTAKDDLYGRMRHIAVSVLAAVEREYNLTSTHVDAENAITDLTPRLEAAKEAALARATQLLGVKPPRGTVPERMRSLLHTAEEELHHQHEDEPAPAALSQQHADRVRLAWRDLQRLANWIAVYDGYVKQSPQMERIAEVVFRLEAEVFGHATVAGKRVATLRVGEPITLPEDVERRDIPQLTLKLEQAVGELLHAS